MVLTSALAAGSILYLQGRFNAGDEKNALVVVQTYHSKSGRSLPDVIAAENAGAVPDWSTTTESSCFQHERVRAQVAAKRASSRTTSWSISTAPRFIPATRMAGARWRRSGP